MIRETTQADKPRLIEMAVRFIVSTPYYHLFPNTTPEQISALIDAVLANGVIFVSEVQNAEWEQSDCDPRLVGMLAVVVVPHPLTGKNYAEEVAWWVEPEYRNGSIGPRLMHHMEGWSRQKRLHMVKMVAPEGSTTGDFYRKCGYQAVETAWLKVL